MENSKQCSVCVFFTPPTIKGSSGKCDYPIPGWIKIHIGGGGWVVGYEAEDCTTFKSRADIVAAERVEG